MDAKLRELQRKALTGDTDAALQFVNELNRSQPQTPEEQQLILLRRLCQKFLDETFHELDTGLVIATVSNSDWRRHHFEYQILMPFLRQALTYFAQWMPEGERCNHIHNAHGVARCREKVVPKERYCNRHVTHRDNYPTPTVSQAEIDRVTATEIAQNT